MATKRHPVRVPDGLGPAGSALWEQVTAGYSLRPDRVRVLEDACREADIVDRLEAELTDAPLMVKGSMGQLVPSPLLTEVRLHRSTLAGLLKGLQLAEEPAEAERRAHAVSESARAAARKRWGTSA